MEIDEITLKLNEFTDNKFGFALRSANLHGGTNCVMEFAYNDGSILNTQTRQDCKLFLLKLLPSGFIYDIKFVKKYITQDSIKSQVEDIIKHSFPAMVYKFSALEENDGAFKVKLEIDEQVEEYAKAKNFENNLKKQLSDLNFANFEVELCLEKSENFESVEIEEEFDARPEPPKTIELTEVSALCGEKVLGPASLIKNHKTPSAEVVTLCGKIKYITSKEYKKKKKGDGAESDAAANLDASINGAKTEQNENVGENQLEKTNGGVISAETGALGTNKSEAQPEQTGEYVKKFYRFSIADYSGDINCIYFANKTTQAAAEKLAAGSEIVASGIVEEDSFSGGVTFKVKAISLCVLPEKKEEEVVYKPEPEHYRYCFPEPYISKEQVDLFSAFGVEDEVAPYLKENDIVVFDFETTGLSATDCKIIEIGAVKIHNGKITEQFETFVDPEEHIPEDSTKIHGIIDSDVAGAPNFYKALQDFYKFTRNATLVGYNVSFDYSFLLKYGREAGYNFDNPQIDVLKLAVKNVHGLKNYKLKTVATGLGVLLDNAHRAVYDAIATAEVFIKLAKYIEQ